MFLAYFNNVLPPLFLFFELFFSKIVMRITHFWVHGLFFLLWWALNQKTSMFADQKDFPNTMIRGTVYEVLGLLVGLLFSYLIVCIISKLIYKFQSYKGEAPLTNDIAENRVKSYQNTLIAEVEKQNYSPDGEKIPISNEDMVSIKEGVIQFNREMIQNYIDRDYPNDNSIRATAVVQSESNLSEDLNEEE